MEDRPYPKIKVGSKFQIVDGYEPYLPTGGILTLNENFDATTALFSREDGQQIFCRWARLKPLEKCTSPVGCWIERNYDAEKCDCIYNSVAKSKINDPVKNPSHYQHGGIETKEIIRTMLTPEEYRGYCKGNIIKYRERAEHKGNAEQDYEKAREYMKFLKEVE